MVNNRPVDHTGHLSPLCSEFCTLIIYFPLFLFCPCHIHTGRCCTERYLSAAIYVIYRWQFVPPAPHSPRDVWCAVISVMIVHTSEITLVAECTLVTAYYHSYRPFYHSYCLYLSERAISIRTWSGSKGQLQEYHLTNYHTTHYLYIVPYWQVFDTCWSMVIQFYECGENYFTTCILHRNE